MWVQSKVFTKGHCKYTFPSLRNTIPLGLDSVSVENIRKYHQKARDYMFAYFQGFVAGPKLEEQIKLQISQEGWDKLIMFDFSSRVYVTRC